MQFNRSFHNIFVLHMSNQPTTQPVIQSVTQTVPVSTGVMQSMSYVQPNSGATYANYGAVYYPTPQAPSQPTPLQYVCCK